MRYDLPPEPVTSVHEEEAGVSKSTSDQKEKADVSNSADVATGDESNAATSTPL